MGRVVRESIGEIEDDRPFLDTEHGPIHAYKDKRITLPEAFDDEYFRHIQWAHLASGGAGGGMRWPNRSPHTLTDGMRAAQLAMSRFMPNINWLRFNRKNVSNELEVRAGGRLVKRKVARFGCISPDQAILYLLRRDALAPDGRLNRDAAALDISLRVPGLVEGTWRVCVWDTVRGTTMSNSTEYLQANGPLNLPKLVGDYAVALQLVHEQMPQQAGSGSA